MSENANGSAPEDAGILRGDRRRFLTGAALAAGATLAGSGRVRRARAADRAEITFASAQVLRQGAPSPTSSRPTTSRRARCTSPTSSCRRPVAVDRGAPGARAAAGPAQRHARRVHAGRDLDRRVRGRRLGVAAGRAYRRQGPGPVLPGHHRGLHLPGQADRAALVRRFRHALLSHRPAREGRRQGARDLGRAGRDRAEAPGGRATPSSATSGRASRPRSWSATWSRSSARTAARSSAPDGKQPC